MASEFGIEPADEVAQRRGLTPFLRGEHVRGLMYLRAIQGELGRYIQHERPTAAGSVRPACGTERSASPRATAGQPLRTPRT